VLDPADSGVPRGCWPGAKGLLDVGSGPISSATVFNLSELRGTASVPPTGTRVARARFNASLLSDLEVIYAVPQNKPGAQHFGSACSGFPDGSLLVSIGDWPAIAAATRRCLIRRQAQNAARAWASCLAQSPGGAQPVASLCHARGGGGGSAQGSGATTTPQCAGPGLTAFNRRVWLSGTRRPAAAMSSTWWRPRRELRLACGHPIAASIPVRRSLRSISTQDWWIHGGSGPRAFAPSVWLIDRGDR